MTASREQQQHTQPPQVGGIEVNAPVYGPIIYAPVIVVNAAPQQSRARRWLEVAALVVTIAGFLVGVAAAVAGFLAL